VYARTVYGGIELKGAAMVAMCWTDGDGEAQAEGVLSCLLQVLWCSDGLPGGLMNSDV
jgi:hypothetical protein